MFWNRTKNISFFVSLGVHLLIILFLFFLRFSVQTDESDYVLMGFGSFGKAFAVRTVKKKTSAKKNKKVNLPKVRNTDKTNNVVPKKEKKKKKEEKIEQEEDFGNYGFKIDFGGKGIRKIYSYELPAYPPGVHKEIDVKLRFTILPDGTVTNIFPLIKADTRLEMAAINSLRNWRFEPLPPGKKKVLQTAVIVFPYRLK